MTVAMKVAGDGSVDSHVFENLRERRNPVLPMVQCLNCVTPVPVRGQRPEAGKRWKPAVIGEAQGVLQGCFRLPIGNHIKQTHPPVGSRRGVDPGVIESRAIVEGVSNTEPQLPTPGSAGPSMKTEGSH